MGSAHDRYGGRVLASAVVASAPAAALQSDDSREFDAAGDEIATHEVRINDRIRAREVFLVGSDGEQLGVKPLPEALAMARDLNLDLVEVAPNANPPVCRVMDHGRYVYEQEQRRRKSKGKATNVVIKEMKFRPKIDEHDYVTKMKHVERFLGEGNKVKLTIMFRGREMAHPELGMRILRRIAEDLNEAAVVESEPRQDGRNMTMVLHPAKKDGRSAPAKAATSPKPAVSGNGSVAPTAPAAAVVPAAPVVPVAPAVPAPASGDTPTP